MVFFFKNVVAYEDPVPNPGGVGRPRTYGIKRRLMDLFESMGDRFEKTTIVLYGQSKEVSFLCLDLIWRPIGEKVRFVLVRDGSAKFILMCSDLELPAYDIIRAYSYRFKIAELSRRIVVSINTIRNWEQGKLYPTGPAKALLKLLDKIPETALSALD